MFIKKSNTHSKILRVLDFIWPIKTNELPKFLTLTLLMFCILAIQNLIRAVKDSIIITSIGPESVSFLKIWGVLPTSFLMTIIYIKLVNILRKDIIFYIITSTFLAFFSLFAFLLYPYHQYIHLNIDRSNSLIISMPHLKWFILLLSNWSFSIFYIISELWAGTVFALLVWQFINQITTIDESKRFYPIFGLLSQIGLYISGAFLVKLPLINNYLLKIYDLSIDRNILSVQLIMTIVITLGVIALVSFWIINNKILDIKTLENLQVNSEKNDLSLKESYKLIINSRYIRLITILLVTYGMTMNLIEGPWKEKVRSIYPDNTEFIAFIGSYLSKMGISAILFVIICSNAVRRLGWLTTAIIPPLIVLFTGGLFFFTSNYDCITIFIMLAFNITDPVLVIISIGAFQNILSKSSKYTLFDATKEMSYVPLSKELKTKGKAAADILGIKLGKAIAALLQSIIFIITPSVTFQDISIYLMYFFILICTVWIWSVYELNKEYKKACANI